LPHWTGHNDSNGSLFSIDHSKFLFILSAKQSQSSLSVFYQLLWQTASWLKTPPMH